MCKAVFLDRDGVINVDKNYVFKIEDLEFISGSVDALKKLHENGFLLIIITNQSGIGRGYYSEEDYLNFRKHMTDELEKLGVKIDDEYYCKHAPEENCECRKPSTKLIDDAIKNYDIDITKSFFIGDKTSDIKAGKNAGLKTILVKTGKAGRDKKYPISPDFVCDNLEKASKVILDD